MIFKDMIYANRDDLMRYKAMIYHAKVVEKLASRKLNKNLKRTDDWN